MYAGVCLCVVALTWTRFPRTGPPRQGWRRPVYNNARVVVLRRGRAPRPVQGYKRRRPRKSRGNVVVVVVVDRNNNIIYYYYYYRCSNILSAPRGLRALVHVFLRRCGGGRSVSS